MSFHSIFEFAFHNTNSQSGGAIFNLFYTHLDITHTRNINNYQELQFEISQTIPDYEYNVSANINGHIITYTVHDLINFNYNIPHNLIITIRKKEAVKQPSTKKSQTQSVSVRPLTRTSSKSSDLFLPSINNITSSWSSSR